MGINVLLIEDENDWVKIITGWLKTCKQIKLAECAKTEDKALSVLRKQHIDIVLLDLCLGDGMGGIDLVEKIHKISDAKIIIITSVPKVQHELFSKGISGYLYKDQLNALCSTIVKVFEGNHPFENLLKEYEKDEKLLRLAILTIAEKDVLKHLLKGETISQISADCQVSESTIKNQTSSIYRKLQIFERGKKRREKLKEQYSVVSEYL